MKLLKLGLLLTLISALNRVSADDLSTFDGEVLLIPVVNLSDQIGKYERVQFKVAKDGRWDLIRFTEPKQATVETIGIHMQESSPVQIEVIVKGYFPNGCYGLGKTHIVRDAYKFNIVINMSELQTFAVCTQALVPFEQSIPLEVNGLPTGIYQVDVNGVTDSFELR